MEHDPSTLPPGTKLGHFKILRAIGSGAMGVVYEAEHVDLRKRVAIKTLKSELAANAELKERFVREGIAASRIRHPHAVDIFDVGARGDLAYLVMEYLEGESLADALTRERRLGVGRTLGVMIPVMAAVNAANAEGVVHRDLKPENIFLAATRDGVVVPKVLDFGFSKLTVQSRPARLTGGDSLFGTPAYMSPEQITDPRGVDARADQWALGVILFECVTGLLPFGGDSTYAVMKEIVEGRPRSLRSTSVLTPAEFVGVVERALERDPDDRFASVADMIRALLPLAPRRTRSAWMPVFAPQTGRHPSEMPTVPSPPAIRRATLESLPEAVHAVLPERPEVRPSTRTSEPQWAKGARSWRSFLALTTLAVVVGAATAWLRRGMPPPATRSVATGTVRPRLVPVAPPTSNN